MKTVASFIIVLFLVFTGAAAHPVHVTVSNLDMDADSGRIDYSIRFFYDDFQALINQSYNTDLDFELRNRLTTKEQNAIIDYVSSSFQLIVNNGELLPSEFTGWKKEGASVWFYFRVELKPEIENLTLRNSLLLDLFDDQSNLVILESKGKQAGWEFNKRNRVQNIKF